MKKSDITQELVNTFPLWSKVRTDEQSVGQQFLNAVAQPMEYMEKRLVFMRSNQYVTTANLDEIDYTYKVQLDTDFEFDEDITDPLESHTVTPEVSGLLSSTWYPIYEAEFNNIQSFWYDSIPNRVSLDNTISGVDHELFTMDAGDAIISGVFNHHIDDGGKIFVEAVGGVQYLTFEQEQVFRGRVVVKGTTRKGTEEEETFIFPWDMKQASRKEWKQITEANVFDMEDDVNIEVRSADFNGGPYLSFWNLKYSDNRNKIDEFWDLGHNGSIPTLDRLEYQSDEWQQLVLGFSSTDIKDRWELLDSSYSTISGVDIALQPFTDRVWVVTADNKLFAYDLKEDTVSGVENLKDATPGAHIQLDYDDDHVLLGEDIEFVPWHARPLKELLSYRIWYQRPDGEKFGLLNGSSVAFSSDFRVKIPLGTKLTRTIENFISIPTTMRGEYLVVFEVTFVDEEIQEIRRIFTVRYKEPLVELDLSGIIPGTIDGIDFDSDQKMWVKSGNDYYQIGLHTDVMLIDYTNKIIYFKEEYEEVGIETNG